MLLKPLLDGNHCSLVRLRRRVGPVKDPDLLEEVDGDATAFSLGDFRAKPDEERFDVLPGDVRAALLSKTGEPSRRTCYVTRV
jgi:hypothetical protein